MVTGSNPAAAASWSRSPVRAAAWPKILTTWVPRLPANSRLPPAGVLPGDPALLVRGGAERQVGLAEQPVVGDHAVAGRVDAGQAGPHRRVHADRAAGAEGGPGADGEAGFRTDPGHHQDQPGVHGDRRAVCGDRLDPQRGGLAALGATDLLHRGAGEHGHAAGFQLGADQGAELAVDGGQHLGELLELGHPQSPGGQRVGHLQADVARADDDRAAGRGVLQGAHDGEGVVHRVQQVHPVAGPECVQAGDGRPGRDGAGADDQLVVADDVLGSAGTGDRQLAAGDVDAAGEGVQPQPHARRLPGRRWCGARGCASGRPHRRRSRGCRRWRSSGRRRPPRP